ncbi:MAG TPA: glycoside hydrolase family 2 TIM barrel-domain containing protein [Phycisphaerae bacterium]|nr:glycoside hydrolase family 2 TIM barrel-domain containing protein [Phycisphaerae bacterium]
MKLQRWFVGVMGLLLITGGARADVGRMSFDADWKFSRDDAVGAEVAGFDDKGWDAVQLPHDWSIGGAIEKGNATGSAGGFFPAGVGWYRKTFVAPAAWGGGGKRVTIGFDGVYMLSEVWVNGQKVGEHAYGYTPFSFDVTSHLKVGAENTIAVRVDNSKQVNSRWYSGSGIYRHVWVEVTGPVRIARDGVVVRTVKASEKEATLEMTVTAESDGAADVDLATELFAAGVDGKPTGAGLARFTPMTGSAASGGPASVKRVTADATLSEPRLWSPESPARYVAVTTASVNGAVVDRRETVFGVRTIEVSAEKGFFLNGNRVVLFGGCVHHDNGALGAAAFDRAEERKVELLKATGFNAVRTSHNPPSPAFLNACDRLGLMVIEEAFDCWEMGKNNEDYHKYFKEQWKSDVDAMVIRDRNHPSVVMWSIGNEIPDFGSAQGLRNGTALIEEVKRLDPTRPVTAAVNCWPGIGGKEHDWKWEDADGLMGKLGVVGYNYQIWRYAKDHERVPGRVMVSTESFPRDMFACWAACEEKPYVVGDFVWTAMDYLGESGIGRSYAAGQKAYSHAASEQFPYHGAYCGDIDITGWRKPVSHARNITWDRGEKLYSSVVEPTGGGRDGKPWHATDWGVVPSWESWTWPGFEGKSLEVQVYSRCERVRLYVNDVLVGEKPTGLAEQFKAVFNVPYAPGVLRTVGVVDRHEVASNELRTAGAVAGIRLVPDRTVIAADGEDLSFIAVESVDKEGNFQPNGDAEVKFAVDGPGGAGTIAGVASGDLSGTEGYQGNRRRLFHGRAQVIVRSSHQAGMINVHATAEGLAEGRVRIEAR